MTVTDALRAALAAHQRGDLDQAARAYERVLARDPDHADALHLLGVLAHQRGDHARAALLITRALTLQPASPLFLANLAEPLRRLGRLDQTAAASRGALQLQPNFPAANNNLGMALLDLGRPVEAASAFRAAVALDPGFAMAHNNLGNALRLAGDAAGALEHFRAAAALDPNLAEAHSNLGQLLVERYQRHEALVHCTQAVRLRPGFADAHNNLGNVLRELGRLDEARASYHEALRLDPGLAITYNNLGQAFQEEGALDQALAWYQQALQRDPRSARIQCNTASALEEARRRDEAIARYEQALTLDPAYAEAYSGLGWVRHEQGRFPEALAHYRQALARKPDLVTAQVNLGTLLEELNDFPAAESALRAALQHDPDDAGALAQLATLLRGKLPDADLNVAQRRAAEPHLTSARRSALEFGLALVRDARGEYDQAAALLERANAARAQEFRHRGQAYDPAQHDAFVADLIATCGVSFFERLAAPARGSESDFGSDAERPIFIVGLPRSGTTLTEQVLARHPRVFGAGEPSLVPETFDALPAFMATSEPAVACLARLDHDTARRLAARHLEHLRAIDDHAPRIVDKLPDNYLHLGFLAALFPKARFIHCRRDLRDVAVSCWMTNFRHIAWSCDPAHIAHRFVACTRIMDHWRAVLPVPLLEVDYEETVADLEGMARRLVAFCGLDWDPACLAFHEGERPVRTASVTQVRQPIYTRSVARWRHYEQSLAPVLARLA
jgi:tetratricopeptide (TPR) repeat protein